MRADPDLEKELGEGWFFARSRMPRTWIHKLNQRRSGAGLSVKAVPQLVVSFGERLSAIKFLLDLNYLTHGSDGRLIPNHLMPRDVHLPFIEGNPKVAVQKVIAWHKMSLPTANDWEGMRADPDLEKELGEGWFFARSRVPRTWIHKLNQRRKCIAELDEKHYQALRLAQSARSSPLSRCAENIDSALSIEAQRCHVYSYAARAEEARLLAGTGSSMYLNTRRVYEHLKAGRARPDNVDFLPLEFQDAKKNKRNTEYRFLESLRRHARSDKLGPRSSSSTKASSTTFE